MKYRFITGSYASAGEPGVCLIRYDPEAGFQIEEAYHGFVNPSFVAVHPEKPMAYAVEEACPEGAVHVVRWDGGRLESLQTFPTGGGDPCHLSLSKDLRRLYAANYTTGSLAVFLLDETGMILERGCVRQHIGRGAHPQRQEGPHVHFSMEKDGKLYVCDLGLDKVVVYEEREGALYETGHIPFPPASGPRHLAACDAFPERLYCASELNSQVYVLERRDENNYGIIQHVSTLPPACPENNTTAAIRFSPDGRILMVSNRGYDSIAAFKVDQEGRLSGPAVSRCVAQPRDFIAVGGDVIVGSQRDSVIHAYRMNRETLRLEDTGWELKLPRPTCITPCNWEK